MRLKSRGLGRKELVMDFREYSAVEEDGEVVVVGTIRDPVNWDFSIRVCEDDIVGMTKLIFRPAMIRLLLRAVFKTRKRDHWTQDYAEHIAEGKERLASAVVKGEERIRARAEGGEIPGETRPVRRRPTRAEPTR